MGNIISLSDLRAEGVDGQDERLEQLIRWAEQWIERATGYRFYSYEADITLDGKYDPVLALPQPVISVDSVEEDGSALASTEYAVYNRRPPDFDDRLNPRLVRLSSSSVWFQEATTAWDTGEGRWAAGVQNIVVDGTFGFTENVGGVEVPPEEVKRALVRLVARETYRVGVAAEHQAQRARTWGRSFESGGISVTLSELAQSGGPTGDPSIDGVVERYRHPRKAARHPLAFWGA